MWQFHTMMNFCLCLERGEEIEFQNKLKQNLIPKCVLKPGGVALYLTWSANKTVKPNSNAAFHSLALHPIQWDKSDSTPLLMSHCVGRGPFRMKPAWDRRDRQGLDGCYLLGLDLIVTILILTRDWRDLSCPVLTWRVLSVASDKHFFVSLTAGRVAGW